MPLWSIPSLAFASSTVDFKVKSVISTLQGKLASSSYGGLEIVKQVNFARVNLSQRSELFNIAPAAEIVQSNGQKYSQPDKYKSEKYCMKRSFWILYDFALVKILL